MAKKFSKGTANKRKGQGMPLTPLEKHRRSGKVLKSPLHEIQELTFSSWRDTYLPETLWAILLAGQLPRDRYLGVFREVLGRLQAKAKKYKGRTLSHSSLARLPQKDFNHLFENICKSPEVSDALTPLMLIKCLPDRKRWKNLLEDSVDDLAWKQLAACVARSIYHQSQEATDCRWLRLMSMVVRGIVQFSSSMETRVEQLYHYPKKGDMRSVRPFIRAGEMSTRRPEWETGENPAWAEEFWGECFDSTSCLPLEMYMEGNSPDYRALFVEIHSVYEILTDYFMDTIQTTGLDPKHDAAFGLTFYVLHILFLTAKGDFGRTTQGRLILRCVFEAYGNLRYLAVKDDSSLWLAYRNYGSGQAKLAFLKNIDESKLPSFLKLENLEALANEDMWIEFRDVNLGAWANKNLRELAIDGGFKDEYDRYYDVLSGYVHSNWAAVRESIFVECVNPLHRFHRIPVPPRVHFPDVIPDLVDIANKCLEQVGALYSPFENRIKLNLDDKSADIKSVENEKFDSK